MSADNGVYILTTSGPEYRVAHLQAVENIYYDRMFDSSNPNVHIKNARKMWAGSKVFTDEAEAMREAKRIYDEIMHDDFCPICEYGICFINIDRKF